MSMRLILIHPLNYMMTPSIEIARRGYKKFLKGRFYPKLDTEKVKNKFNQWKEEIYYERVNPL